jgi:hypothetical protein
MVAGAFDLHRLAVQKEALLRIEAEGADAEGRFVPIYHRAARFDYREQPVQVRLFDGPELRLPDRGLCSNSCVPPTEMASSSERTVAAVAPAPSRSVDVMRQRFSAPLSFLISQGGKPGDASALQPCPTHSALDCG